MAPLAALPLPPAVERHGSGFKQAAHAAHVAGVLRPAAEEALDQAAQRVLTFGRCLPART